MAQALEVASPVDQRYDRVTRAEHPKIGMGVASLVSRDEPLPDRRVLGLGLYCVLLERVRIRGRVRDHLRILLFAHTV
jgi:hypothetical protein